MIKSIIFDFDGVIHDTFDLAYGVNKLVSNLTVEEYKDMFNGNLYAHPTVTLENENKYFAISSKLFNDLVIEEQTKAELLKLKDRFDLFIVSSNNEESLNAYLGNNGIMHVFKRVLGKETHRSKVEKFKILMDEHGVTKDNSIFVTDTLGDILEANKLGLTTIAVDYGFHERERLEKGNPHRIISDFNEVLVVVEALGS
jgi:HAD superfamily hydrolase (TIGR01509 family)